MARDRTLRRAALAALALATLAGTAAAGDVAIVAVVARSEGAGNWHFDVTLRHDDTGWEHYADAWRVLGPDGAVLATRTLYHPHVAEQPFTRGLGGVAVPGAAATLTVEARDKVHGWSADRVAVDLSAPSGDRYRVVR